ncbi:MAG: methyltransferase FkbM [Rhodospirillaceae bacterium]|nr:methyltransferase FkbM [Rhodospirillaceae bacterium]
MAKADPPLLRNVQELVKPGFVIWDIGANVGLLTFAAAAISGAKGAVVAFEPDSWLLQILRRSRARQSAASAPVTIVPAAVASGVGLRQFNLAARSRASNSLAEYGHSQTGGVMEEYTVPTFTLDWLLDNQPEPDLIKCDVEGAEVEVFRDQIKMLKEIRPIIMCEVGDEMSDEITAIFADSGYKLFDGEKPLSRASTVTRASWNTIAIPEEKCEALVGVYETATTAA